MASLTYLDQAATFEPQGDNMVMTLTSGGEVQRFVIPRHLSAVTAANAARATREWFGEQQRADVVSFPKAKRRARA